MIVGMGRKKQPKTDGVPSRERGLGGLIVLLSLGLGLLLARAALCLVTTMLPGCGA